MNTLTYVIKFYLIPGSLSFLILTATLAVVLLAQPRETGRRTGRRLLFGLIGGYWFFSLAGVADALQHGYPRLSTLEADRCLRSGTCAIVVLSSGMQTFRSGDREISVALPQTILNALKGSELAGLGDAPIIVSGGAAAGARPGTATEADLVAQLLRQLGVPDRRLLIEGRSRTTYEQAQEVTRMARAHGISELALISSPPHVRRALAVFRAQGMAAAGYPADFMSDPGATASRWRPLQPSPGTLSISREALYEYCALSYYWIRGWTRAPAP